MRGGLVAAGIILVFFGIAWFVPLLFGGAFGGLGGALGALCLWIVLAPIFIIIGLLLFIAGLVAKSDTELAALRPAYVPWYSPPASPPQVVYVQAPSVQEYVIRRSPPPPRA